MDKFYLEFDKILNKIYEILEKIKEKNSPKNCENFEKIGIIQKLRNKLWEKFENFKVNFRKICKILKNFEHLRRYWENLEYFGDAYVIFL